MSYLWLKPTEKNVYKRENTVIDILSNTSKILISNKHFIKPYMYVLFNWKAFMIYRNALLHIHRHSYIFGIGKFS